MNRRATAALLAIFSLVASASAAQTATSFVDPASGLSLDEAITRAVAQEPTLRAARATIDVARGTREQAALRRNLSFAAEFRGEPSGTDNQSMFSVEWPLELFRREGRVAVAKREVAAVELSVADRERILIGEVRARYGEALIAVRDLGLLDELVEATSRQYDLLRARVDAGSSPPLERDLVNVELRRMNADRSLQLGRVERAIYELKRILGAAPDEALRLRDPLEDVVRRDYAETPAPPDPQQPRSDVREAAARVAVADARIGLAEREGRFDVSLFAGYSRMDSAFPQLGVSPSGALEPIRGVFHYVTGGATLTIPLFNRNQGEVAAARAERAGAVALQEAAALSAQTEVASARSLDQRAHEAVQLYGGDARTLARQNLSVVRQGYELGRTTIFEVLAEQKRYLDLERAYTETLRAAYEARTALKRAVGDMR